LDEAGQTAVRSRRRSSLKNCLRLSAVYGGAIIATLPLFGVATNDRGPHAVAVELG
jgi:hypothetical protein